MRNLIIVGYTYPSNPGWGEIKKHADSIYAVIVNPSSGVGEYADPEYVNLIQELQALSILVIGYVSSRYGGRPLPEVSGEVQKWKDWYRPNGIFLDEMSSATITRLPNGTTRDDLSYYRRASGICYSTIGNGSIVVMNPGAVPDSKYASIQNVILCVAETDEDTYGSRDFPAWLDAIRDRTYHIVYAVTDAPWVWALVAKNNPGFVYLCTTLAPDPQFSIEDTIWPAETEAPPVIPPDPSDNNQAVMMLREVANIIGMPADSTLKDVPAKVRNIIARMDYLEDEINTGIQAATDERILADVLRRMKRL